MNSTQWKNSAEGCEGMEWNEREWVGEKRRGMKKRKKKVML